MSEDLKLFLESYDPSQYERPSVTTDVVILTIDDEKMLNKRKNSEVNLQVLLVKRKDHPYKGQWALPGGFIQMDESLVVSAKRELKEETNVSGVHIEQLYTWGDEVDRDPRTRIISVSYLALVNKEGHDIIASDDAEDVKWFNIESLSVMNNGKSIELSKEINADVMVTTNIYTLTSEDKEVTLNYSITNTLIRKKATQNKETVQVISSDPSIAFDHGKVIDYALERLRNKIKYTPIAFNLVPDYFTLAHLQSVYEVILKERLIRPNFRRKIAPMIEETNLYETGKQMRPAKLFKQAVNWDSWE